MNQRRRPVHLTRAYRYVPRSERAAPDSRIDASEPITACNLTGVAQISIYDHPDQEEKITCQPCLDWLSDGDNRLLVTKGGVEEWIRNHVAAGDRDIRYIDIPIDSDGT